MANYRDIKGFTVQSASTDPAPYVGSWSSGSNMNSARFLQGGAGASNTAAITFGGRNPSLSPGPNVALTESYDGSSWTEVGDLNHAASYYAGMGTNTAALAVGGSPPATAGYTEAWNGASWTEKNALSRGPSSPQASTYGMGNGTTTSALFYGGDEGANSQDRTEEFDGTNWTEVGDLNTGRGYGAGFGTNAEEAICAGGLAHPTGNLAITEKWNGTSWTEVGDLNTARLLYNGASTQAPSSDGIVYSGRNVSTNASFANTESWNGTSWTEVADLATARRAGGGGGVATNAILSGGSPDGSPPYSTSNVTEEWSFPSGPSFLIEGQMWFNTTTSVLKGLARDVAEGTWASGGNMNNANAAVGSFGISTAAIEFGGYYPPGSAPGRITTEEYNGTTWTEKSDMSNYRAERPGAGTTAAGLAIRGNPGDATAVEAWGGSSWTAANGTNTPSGGNSACGTQTAAITFGGETTANTELYDGTSWTEVNNMNTARGKMSGSGVQSSAVGSGGTPGPQVLAETWDGSTWSEVTENNTPRSAGAAGGTSNSSSLAFGGGPSRTNNTEYWNGSSWTEVANLSTATQDMNYGNVGTTGGTLAIGGDPSPSPVSTRTEAWSSTDAVTTITTS